MSDYATLFCKRDGSDAIIKTLENQYGLSCDHLPDRVAWEQIVVEVASSSMKLTAIKFVQPQDKFSKTILGMANAIRTTPTSAKSNQKFIMDWLKTCKVIVGVVLDLNAVTLDILLQLAEQTEALIFLEGSEIYDSTGTKILSLDGTFDRVMP